MLFALTVCAFGLVRGLSHALEPDHLAAVSTLMAERSPAAQGTNAGARRAGVPTGLLLGAAWGVGHTLVLLIVGGALLALRVQVPEAVERVLELGVALMLVVLGAQALSRALLQGTAPSAARRHRHRNHDHAHGGARDHVHVGRWSLARRPLLVGVVHGLAGSGALVALVFAEIRSAPVAAVYVLLFGFGSTVGMAGLTGLLGASLSPALRNARGLSLVLGVSGLVSVGLGLVSGWAHLSRLLS
jgi:hypothetical protein